MLALPQPGDGQEPPAGAAIIDTVILERYSVFTPEEAEGSGIFRTMNSLHVVTRPWVVRGELLLEAGQPYDEDAAMESERNLRNRFLFTEVAIDTVRTDDGRLALRVRTDDAWSTKPKFRFSVAPDGTLVGIVGITEANLVGTGILAQVWFRKDVDRQGLDLALQSRRAFGSPILFEGTYQGLSDQTIGTWRAGVPFYSVTDRLSGEVDGEVFDGRVLQFRTEIGMPLDTTTFFRRALINRVTLSHAPIASPRRYLRLGLTGEIRREEYMMLDDSLGIVPDTIYGQVGAFAEYRDIDYRVMRYFNGFSEEDVDLSERIRLGANLALESWGYSRNGVGPSVSLQGGAAWGGGLLKAGVEANALFNSAGLDSGRVVANATLGLKPTRRQTTLIHIEVASLDNPPPGGQVDFGFTLPPRLWAPRAFTGDRSFRTSLEHRVYAWDKLFNIVGIGFAGFLDWAGAWYSDQEARKGGNIGVSLLVGSALSAVAQNGTLNIGYLFGNDVPEGSRIGVSFIAGFVF
ncbi:MAG: hypothetical protein ACC682_11200 [Gemmatimonadota bacterium]